MNGVRKLACGVVCAVAAFGFARAADPVVAVAVEDFSTCVPVVTATFDEGTASVAFEWSDAEDGTYATLGTVANPTGTSCAFTNDWALVGNQRWYRAKVGETASAAVAFTRFRRLERNTKDDRVMTVGCKPLSSYSARFNPFDGSTGTTQDNGSGQNVVGVDFGSAVHVACVRWYARNNRMGNNSKNRFYGAATRADYDAGTSSVRSGTLTSSVGWFSTMLSDVDSPIQCCWTTPDRGDCQELQLYGWAPIDVTNANGAVSLDYVPVEESTNFWPIVTATHQLGVTNFKLQRATTAVGPFTDLLSVDNPSGTTHVYTNTAAKVGQTIYYRVMTTGGGIGDYASKPVSFVRFRQLERDPADLTKVRAGYSTLSGKTTDFDGNTETYSATNPHGIDFKEQVHLAAFRFYPRTTQTARLNDRFAYADTTEEERSAGHHVEITPWIAQGGLEWRWLDSVDTDTAFRYCFINTLTPGGDLAEMQIFGWTAADIEAAGDPYYPTALEAVNGESAGVVRLTWSGGKNLVSYEVQSRIAGTDAWTTCVTGLEPTVETCEVSGLDSGKTYEFRVKGEGRGGEIGYSPMASAFVYQLVPGTGTGLQAALMGPCGTRQFTTPWTYEYRVFTNVCLDVTTNTLFEGSSAQDALVVLRGQLIIPLDGTYTLSLTAGSSDGTALYLDGAFAWNVFSGGSFQSATRTLTAGNHSIEIHYRSPNKARLLKFQWALDGVWSARIVPQSQLVPASLADCRVYEPSQCEGWSYSIGTGASRIPRLEWLGSNSFRMNADGSDLTYNNLAFLTKTVKGAFTLEAEFDSTKNAGRGCLTVCDPDKPTDTIINFIVTSESIGMKHNGDWGGVSWTSINSGKTRARIRRLEDKTLIFEVKNSKWDSGKTWHTCVTMPQGTLTYGGITISIVGDKVATGYSQAGANANYSDVTVSRFQLHQSKGLSIIVR